MLIQQLVCLAEAVPAAMVVWARLCGHPTAVPGCVQAATTDSARQSAVRACVLPTLRRSGRAPRRRAGKHVRTALRKHEIAACALRSSMYSSPMSVHADAMRGLSSAAR